MLTIALAASLLAVAHPGAAPPSPRATVATAELYALAVERLLSGDSGTVAYLLPSAALPDLHVRARRAAGPAHSVTAAEAKAVAARLARRGGHAVRGVRHTLGADDVLQLVLGELRFEPASNPTFARLRIGVVGTGGARQTLDFLLKREPTGWRVLNMEDADSIG
jgi:hypothetical protein